MDLASIRRWDLGSVTQLHSALSMRITTVADAQNALRSIGHLPGWEGEAADAARRDFSASADSLDDELATVGAVRELTRQVEAAVTDLKKQLAALEADASANRMSLHDSGAVTFDAQGMSDADQTAMEKVRLDLEATARALIAQAADIDSDSADVLSRAADGKIDAHGSSGDAAIATGQMQGSLTTAPPPADASPAEVNKYWNALAPEQKGFIVREHPDWVGNRDGIPAVVRDQANRKLLPIEQERLKQERDKLKRDIDNHPLGGLLTNEDAHLWQVEQKLKDLDAVSAQIGSKDVKLMLLDMRSHERGLAAIAVGNPDTARHVSVTTPGLGTTVNGGIESMTNEARALRVQTGQILEADKVGTAEDVASIAWIGYEAPNFSGGGLLDFATDGATAVGTPYRAEAGAVPLASFYKGLDAASEADDLHMTALGHSYGSLTTSLAVQNADGVVDDAVFYGSPGLGDGPTGDGVHDAVDLGLEPGHAYLLEIDRAPVSRDDDGSLVLNPDNDLVADVGAFGGDPSRSDLTRLSTDGGEDKLGQHRESAEGHADYGRQEEGVLNMAGYNMAAVVSGLAERRSVPE